MPHKNDACFLQVVTVVQGMMFEWGCTGRHIDGWWHYFPAAVSRNE